MPSEQCPYKDQMPEDIMNRFTVHRNSKLDIVSHKRSTRKDSSTDREEHPNHRLYRESLVKCRMGKAVNNDKYK